MTQEPEMPPREEIIYPSLCAFSSFLLFSATCCQISFLFLSLSLRVSLIPTDDSSFTGDKFSALKNMEQSR